MVLSLAVVASKPTTFAEYNRPVASTARGLGLMFLATAAFVAMSTCVKLLREAEVPTSDVMVYRMLPGLLWLWWLLRWRLHLSLRPKRRTPVYLRSLFGLGAMATCFYAVASLTLVQYNVLALLQPVFIALLAPLLLRERLQATVLVALVLAGCGALLVLAPDASLAAVPVVPAVLGVISALLSALAHMMVRRSAASEAPEVVVFHFAWHSTVASLAWSLATGDPWRLLTTISPALTPAILGVAVFGVLGQVAMTRAYGHAPATLVAIVAYVGIPLSLTVDLVLWDSPIGPLAIAGAVLMVGAGYLLARTSRTPIPVPQPGQP